MSPEETIELARRAGLRSAMLLDMYKTKEALTPSEELELEQYQTFAADVIKAHEAKLIDGVGEPAVWFDIDTGAARLVKPLRPTYEPCYTSHQVAAAVAIGKYALNADRYARERRIAELESERDMWKATAEAVVDIEKSQMRLRIATLESTLRVALEALEAIVPCIEVHGDQYKPGNMWHTLSDKGTDAIKQIKGVLNGSV